MERGSRGLKKDSFSPTQASDISIQFNTLKYLLQTVVIKGLYESNSTKVAVSKSGIGFG